MRHFLVLLGLCIVTTLRAVTVQWSVPNASYDWYADDGSVGVYFVYSASPVSNFETIKPSVSLVTSGATMFKTVGADLTKSALDETTPIAIGTFADSAFYDEQTNSSKLTNSTGYFYMVVFQTADANNYAVAGGLQYAPKGANGIYDDLIGDVPEAGDYVDVSFIGGTWTAARTPEPTTLALLALGVAGLALRRKVK